MMTFKSSADLVRLQKTNPAHTVISKLIEHDALTHNNLIALMEPDDMGHRNKLWEHCRPNNSSIVGILQLPSMYIVVLDTEMQFGVAVVIPDEDWLSRDLRMNIELNLKHNSIN